jgi:dGTPase
LDRNKLTGNSDLNEKLGMLRAMAIGELIDSCTAVFLSHDQQLLEGTFDQALTELCDYHQTLKEITTVSIEKIYRARHVVEIEASGHQILPGLLEEFTQAGIHVLESKISRKYENLLLLLPVEIISQIKSRPDDTYHMLRCMIDFISGLTDRHALSLYRKIKGISLT